MSCDPDYYDHILILHVWLPQHETDTSFLFWWIDWYSVVSNPTWSSVCKCSFSDAQVHVVSSFFALTCSLFFCVQLQVKVWFQNRRMKWKRCKGAREKELAEKRLHAMEAKLGLPPGSSSALTAGGATMPGNVVTNGSDMNGGMGGAPPGSFSDGSLSPPRPLDLQRTPDGYGSPENDYKEYKMMQNPEWAVPFIKRSLSTFIEVLFLDLQTLENRRNLLNLN